jgi:hypothetical protein
MIAVLFEVTPLSGQEAPHDSNEALLAHNPPPT